MPERVQKLTGPGITRSIPATVLRLAAATVFGFAAWVKIGDPAAFARSIDTFAFMPDHLIIPSAFAIPWIEAIVALALVLGFWARPAALVYVALLASFTGLIYYTLEREMNVQCGCFGKFKLMCDAGISKCNLKQNALLIGIGLVSLILGPGRWSIDDLRRRASLREGNAFDA